MNTHNWLNYISIESGYDLMLENSMTYLFDSRLDYVESAAVLG